MRLGACSKMPFRFVHTADIHLDSPLRSLAMRNSELAELIGGSTRQALVGIVDLCLEERVDALIIAGDLYDGDQTSMKTARFLADQMRRLHEAGILVFKVRGNHDALSRITQEIVLPPSLKLFGGRAETAELRAGGLDVAIHGLSFSRPHAPESLLSKYGRPRPGVVNVGIMHTSLAGAAGHDPYAPCAVSDLHAWGFSYWALGHVHVRSEHREASAIVMSGMPQGRDIGEAGPKTVSLVTVTDDHCILVEERLTSIAQFERVPVDLTDAETWPEIIDTIEREIAIARDATAAPHLVARLVLVGRTNLSWRMRRDRDLLRNDVEHRLENCGRTWIDKVEVGTTAIRGMTPSTGAPDPVDELGALIRDEIMPRHDVRESVAALVKEIRDDLPPDARRFCGDDQAGFDGFVDRLLGDSGEEIVARLAHNGAEFR